MYRSRWNGYLIDSGKQALVLLLYPLPATGTRDQTIILYLSQLDAFSAPGGAAAF